MSEQEKKIIKMAIISSLPGCALPLFIVLIIAVFVSLGLLDSGDSSGDKVVGSGDECGFTISDTSLSKSEFKQLIQEYANSHSQWQIFADNANDYYDYAKAKGVNPELVVTVGGKENNGYETTAGTNNYWGWGCPNGAAKCEGLFSFMDGAKKVLDSASNYDTIYNWFYIGHYSWIGDYWLNPGDSGAGGCYYAKYIYPDNMPERVKNACAAGNECSGSNCQKTVPEEDQAAYSNYLIKVMLSFRRNIFKLEDDEGISCVNRSTSSGLVEDYVQWMINFAADNDHGYSQNTRLMNPNVDCSSFVYYGLLEGAGFTDAELGGNNWPFTTANMKDILKKIGFKIYEYTSESDLQRGDILWRATHTEVYIGNGQNVGAHSNYDGVDGDSSGKEVSVGSTSGNWTSYIRYEGND